MHELAIAQNILRIVEDEMGSRRLQDGLRKIHLKAGKMHAIIPESLAFNFNVIKRQSPLTELAELIIEEIPLVIRCRSCAHQTGIDEALFLCPACGSPAIDIISGQELYIDSLDLKTDND